MLQYYRSRDHFGGLVDLSPNRTTLTMGANKATHGIDVEYKPNINAERK